jgi:L-2-hydroxyglutarate oxidase LhgO
MNNNYEVAIIGGGIIGIHRLWLNRTLHRRNQTTILKSYNNTFNETKHRTFFTNGR